MWSVHLHCTCSQETREESSTQLIFCTPLGPGPSHEIKPCLGWVFLSSLPNLESFLWTCVSIQILNSNKLAVKIHHSTCMYTHVHSGDGEIYMCVYTRGQCQVCVCGLPNTLFFEPGFLSEHGAHQLAKEVDQRTPGPLLPMSSRHLAYRHVLLHSTGDLTQVLMLLGKHFMSRAISPFSTSS